MSTSADYWKTIHGNVATWRTARTSHRCGNQRLHPDHRSACPRGGEGDAIQPTDRYFDTGERAMNPGPWKTIKLCAQCAMREEPQQ